MYLTRVIQSLNDSRKKYVAEDLYKLNEAIFNLPEDDTFDDETVSKLFQAVGKVVKAYNEGSYDQSDQDFGCDYIALLSTLQNQPFFSVKQNQKLLAFLREAVVDDLPQAQAASSRQAPSSDPRVTKDIERLTRDNSILAAEVEKLKALQKAVLTIQKFKLPSKLSGEAQEAKAKDKANGEEEPKEEQKTKKNRKGRKDTIMFHIGTNNWQRQGEFAPGSGILHANFHDTFNAMPGIKCYSIYPSKIQTDPEDDDTVRIFKLDHDIPICESVSPNSSFRWHSMDDDQFAAYRKRLEDAVCSFMDEIETKEGQEIDFLVSHHAFTNAMTGAQILDRRHAEGKTRLRHFNFVHGTALKMYIKEKEKDPEYPLRFLPLTQGHGVFNSLEKTSGIWVNSEDYIGKFAECFPEYPKDHLIFSRIGVNQKTFCPTGSKVADLKKHVRDEDKDKFDSIKQVVTFVGKFADWKRLDAVLYAAAAYEQKFPDLGTMVVGTGPPEAIAQFEGLAKELKLKRVFFLGPKGQDVLAELFSASEVGMFPSYKEPFGMVFIECMACGCPCIGAKSGGPVEFVEEDQGVLVEEQDNWREPAGAKALGERLAVTVGTALKEDWKGKTKGPKCVPFVKASFSTQAQCKEMLANMKAWSRPPKKAPDAV